MRAEKKTEFFRQEREGEAAEVYRLTEIVELKRMTANCKN